MKSEKKMPFHAYSRWLCGVGGSKIVPFKATVFAIGVLASSSNSTSWPTCKIVKRVVFDRLGRKIQVFTAGVRLEVSISLRLRTTLARKARLKAQVYDFSDFTTWHARSGIVGRSPSRGISAMWKIRMKAASQLAALRTSRFNRLTNPLAVA